MKRVLLVLTAIMLVFAVVGCNSNGAPTTVVDKSQQTPTTPTPSTPGEETPGEETPTTPDTPPAPVTSWDGPFTIGVGGTGGTYDATSKTVTIVGGSSVLFYIDFAANGIPNLSTGTFKITYDCTSVSGTGTAKVIAKKGKSSWTDFDPKKYPTFEFGTSKVMTGLPTVADMDGISFQHNVDSNDDVEYTIKITKLELE